MSGRLPVRPPLYTRALRLRHLHPSGLWCFLLFEGMLALGVLLALAELVSWWAVPVLPVAVAAMVKFNDVLAGALRPSARRPAAPAPRQGPDDRPEPSRPGQTGLPAGASPPVMPVPPAGRDAAVAGGGAGPPLRGVRQVSRDLTDALDPVDSPRQQFRQSARRRYR